MSYIGQAPGQGQAERFLFTPSGTGTAVTASDDGVSIGYTVGQVSVYLNGVKQVIGSGKDVTATDGSTITFLAAYAASDVIEVIALSAFSAANTVAATGGTFSGNVTHTGLITANGGIETDTNSKIKQKGAFMQSSTHQALTLGA